MNDPRRSATWAGVLYLVTHVTSVAGLILYDPILNNVDYVIGAGADSRVILGAVLEVILAMAVVGTAVALYPVVKRHNESMALGYVGLRILEAAVIAVGIVSLLAVVTLRQDLAGAAETASLLPLGQSLVAVHDWTFRVGPNLVLATNTVVLALLMVRSRLVPRFIGLLGLVGGPLIFAYATGSTFGLYEHISTFGAIITVPVFAWELSLAGWLIVKGFNPSAPTMRATAGAAPTVPVLEPAGI